MNHIEFKFEEETPEYAGAIVSKPQIIVLNLDIDTAKVIVYFMTNTALSITGGYVKSAMGKVSLQYLAESPNGVYNTSIGLRKVIFTFPNTQGMAKNFKFKGQKT